MSKPTLSLKGPLGLRTLAVLFNHPDKSFLSEERLAKARQLNLKYAKSFVVERESGPFVITVLRTQNGKEYRCPEVEFIRFDHALQLHMEAYLDGVADGQSQALLQRLHG